MNTITKATLVVVFVTLGLASTAWAVEPPKPEPRKGNDAAGTADVPRSAPVEGEPVDIGRWAYVFR